MLNMNSIQNWSSKKHILILLSSLTIFLILCLCTELILRTFKLEPTVTDDIKLWALKRDKINGYRNQIALLGNSRMLTNFDVQKAQKDFPQKEFIQLSMLGSSPLPVLKDLSKDASFKGLAIVSLWEPELGSIELDPTNLDNGNSLPQQYLHYYHNRFSVNDIINREIGTFLQERLVLLHPFYNLRNNLSSIVRRRSPTEFYVVTDRSRSRNADYSLININAERQRRITKVKQLHQSKTKLNLEQWLASVEELVRQVNKIEQRGGRVVFVYFPISGESADWMNKLYPREKYWNHLSNRFGLETIHYQDHPALIFDCPDTSHLDKKDKATFTANLLNLIKP